MRTTPLHTDFGVEVHDVRLREASADHLYPQIRAAFEAHSVLLFRDQHLTDAEQLALGRLFGPLEDRWERETPDIAMVSNEDPSGGVHPADDLKTLQLVANQLWHTDGTFLPVPALANILQARVVSSEGGETELVSTRAGFSRLAPEMQDRLRGMVFRHRYAQSRAKVDPRLAEESYIQKWPDQRWRAVLPNPVTGAQSLYIASHVCGIDGMAQDAALAMIDELTEAMTAPGAIYAHRWTPGDVLIWDDRATLHRGRPWPYDQPRSLASICVSLTEADGLAAMRPA